MKRQNFTKCIAAGIAVYALAGLSMLHASEGKNKPNFVVILADDVSWCDVGCSGAGLYTRTPNIDELSKQGLRFNNFYTASAVCTPVRHELYTGLLPPTSGVFGKGTKPREVFRSAPDYLKELGYSVALTGKRDAPGKRFDFTIVDSWEEGCFGFEPTWSMDGIRQYLVEQKRARRPFCLYLCSVNAHEPWDVGDQANFPPDKMVVPPHMVDTPSTREALSRHAAEVEELDKQVGATMQLLNELELSDNTVLIFLTEQGTQMPGGKFNIYNYGCRAQCIVRWPGAVTPGTTTDAVSMYVDILPTLIDAAGGTSPQGIDGRSLLRVWRNETNEHREHAYITWNKKFQRAICDKRYKLIWTFGQDGVNKWCSERKEVKGKEPGYKKAWNEWLDAAETDAEAKRKVERIALHPTFALYDLANDPWELKNLAEAKEYEPVRNQMWEGLKEDFHRLNDLVAIQKLSSVRE